MKVALKRREETPGYTGEEEFNFFLSVLFPAEDLVEQAREIAKRSGATITLTENVEKGTKNADILYTDIWVSMGEPAEIWEHRIELLKDYHERRIALDAKIDATLKSIQALLSK